MNLRDGSKRGPCLRVSQTLRQGDSGSARGSKMQRYHTIHSPLWPPAWAYRNRTDSHNAPCHSASPRGLLQTAQEFQDRDPTRSTAGRRIPTILRLALLLSGTGIPVFPVWLRCPPSSVFWYCSCSRARVMQAATCEFDGKWIANSDHNKGENLNCSRLRQKKQSGWREPLFLASMLIIMMSSSQLLKIILPMNTWFVLFSGFICVVCLRDILTSKCPKWKC